MVDFGITSETHIPRVVKGKGKVFPIQALEALL
jgi:hypothetical protein